jgi:FkbM family methyltransferase
MIYNHLRRILPQLNNPTVLELGAHIGTDTVRLLSLLQEPYTYLAIEPDPRNLAELRRVGKFRNGVAIINKAIASRTGQTSLYLSDGMTEQGRQYTDGSSIMIPTNEALATGYTWKRPVPVPCITLDDLYKEFGLDRIDFIWADIQGAELEMIQGGQVALANTRYLYTECVDNRILYKGQPNLKQIISVLPGRWDIVMRTQTDVLFRSKRWE